MTSVIAMFLPQGKRKQAFGMQTTPPLPKYMEVNCSRVHRWFTPLITLHTMIDYLTFVWHSHILHFISVNQFGCLVIFGWRYSIEPLAWNAPQLTSQEPGTDQTLQCFALPLQAGWLNSLSAMWNKGSVILCTTEFLLVVNGTFFFAVNWS